MEKWRSSWRVLVRYLRTKGLQELSDALVRNDGAVVARLWIEDRMGRTVACPIAYSIWKARWLFKSFASVQREVTWLRTVCPCTDVFVEWVDSMPPEWKPKLLYEVQRELARRAGTDFFEGSPENKEGETCNDRIPSLC